MIYNSLMTFKMSLLTFDLFLEISLIKRIYDHELLHCNFFKFALNCSKRKYTTAALIYFEFKEESPASFFKTFEYDSTINDSIGTFSNKDNNFT